MVSNDKLGFRAFHVPNTVLRAELSRTHLSANPLSSGMTQKSHSPDFTGKGNNA